MTNLTPRILVPAQDSSDNVYIEDVAGNKTDTGSGNSLYSLAHVNDEHIHSAANVYPSQANGIVVTSAAPAWAIGGFSVIVPPAAIPLPFDIHHIFVEAVSAVDVYEAVLYVGGIGSETEIGRVRFAKTANIATVSSQPFQTIRLPANSRISATLASAGGGGTTATISIFYHVY